MLEFDSYSVWLPGVGVVLDQVSLSPAAGEIWAVVGRSGSGASTLLRAAAHRLLPGAHVSGGIRWRGSTLPPRPRDLHHVGQFPPMGVAEYLRGLTDDVRGVAGRAGLQGHLTHRVDTLPPDLRVALRAVALRHAPDAACVLLDAELTAAAPAVRADIAAEAARRARSGAVVLWADHDLPTLRSTASHVLELDGGRVAHAGELGSWRPRTVGPVAGRGHDGRPSVASATVVEAAAVGLSGRGLEVGAAECVGLIDLSGRPEPLARRIVTHLGGEAVGSHLPRGTRLTRARHDPRPLWLPHAQAGLDPADRQELAADLAGVNPGPRLITGRDPDFLAAACHRIVVVDDGRIVAVGSPTAMARHLTGSVAGEAR